jgi:hypothetical protein
MTWQRDSMNSQQHLAKLKTQVISIGIQMRVFLLKRPLALSLFFEV